MIPLKIWIPKNCSISAMVVFMLFPLCCTEYRFVCWTMFCTIVLSKSKSKYSSGRSTSSGGGENCMFVISCEKSSLLFKTRHLRISLSFCHSFCCFRVSLSKRGTFSRSSPRSTLPAPGGRLLASGRTSGGSSITSSTPSSSSSDASLRKCTGSYTLQRPAVFPVRRPP